MENMKEYKPVTISEKRNYIVALVRYAANITNTYKEKFSRLYREFYNRFGINVNRRVINRKRKISKIEWFVMNGEIDKLYNIAVDLYEK